MSLQQLYQQGRVWRGSDSALQHDGAHALGLASGYAELDRALPLGGWPRGALSEILHAYPGQGELQLLLPALAALSHDERYIVLIDPPWIPYAPALSSADVDLSCVISIGGNQAQRLDDSERYWALEQSLRASQCGAVLAWPRQQLDNKTLRRLQLAAEAGDSCAFLFRHPRFRSQHSPAALRLQLYPVASGLQLEIVKCRGRNPSSTRIELPLSCHRS
jgi:hypothetical protein